MAGGRITNQSYFPEQEEYFLTAHGALTKGQIVSVDFTSGTLESAWQPTATAAAPANNEFGVIAFAMSAAASGAQVWVKVKGMLSVPVPSGVAQGDDLICDAALVEPSGTGAQVKVIALAMEDRDANGNAWIAISGESGFGTGLHT